MNKPTRKYLEALWQGDDAKADALWNGGEVDLTAFDEGQSALHIAVNRGPVESVAELLKRGADPDARRDQESGLPVIGDDHLATPLICMASGWGERASRIMTLLLDAGADVDAQTYFGETALYTAVAQGEDDTTLVSLLLERGANPDLRSLEGESPLMLASDQPAVRALLEEAGADPTGALDALLVMYAEAGMVERVIEFLDQGAQHDCRVRGATPLIAAANAGHGDVVKALIDAGADPNALDSIRRTESATTALYAAAGGGHLECVEHLLAAGADALIGPEKLTPLVFATQSRANAAAKRDPLHEDKHKPWDQLIETLESAGGGKA